MDCKLYTESLGIFLESPQGEGTKTATKWASDTHTHTHTHIHTHTHTSLWPPALPFSVSQTDENEI